MNKNLVIVESPAKAKTIQKFLGKGYTVASSFGHIRDLPAKALSIDLENDFIPQYEVPEGKKKVIKELKKLAKEANLVWLASDEDREGEAISWHLLEALNLNEIKTRRIVFHEITKSAITKALETPRKINKHLVDAQQARRVLDRIVGYELSPVLWKKVKPSLSAGRVQSVAVRLIVEREREITSFNFNADFKVTALFSEKNGKPLKAELTNRFKTKEEAQHFLENCAKSSFEINTIEKKKSSRSPSAPFTTSTLQQEASLKLGFSVTKTMIVAQKLYEAGKITYMRTDSVTLSQDAVNSAKETITNKYGENYSHPKQYKNKTKGAQEAHEAIRPSYLNEETVSGEEDQRRLYELIWKKTIASQMKAAEVDLTKYAIAISESSEIFECKGKVITFEGFLKAYQSKEEKDNLNTKNELPKLNQGDKLTISEILAKEKYNTPPARYTEASLVKKLEQLGIGRPSTYAPTIGTIQKRGYVVKEDREGAQRDITILKLENKKITVSQELENFGFEKKKMFPTDIGVVVTNFLILNFEKILDFKFTANVEEQFDEIAEGKKKWNTMIKEFYSPFHKNIETTLEKAERASGERALGKDPLSGRPLIVRIGRFGPMAQIGKQEDEEPQKFASLLKNQSIESITLEEALELFKLPRDIGIYKDKKVVAAIGRFGPYIRYDGLFCSLKSALGDDPLSIEMERAIELIEEKIEIEKNKYIKSFKKEKIEVLNGRFGPYIKFQKKNYKIPKTITDPKTLTLAQCKKIIAAPPSTKRRGNPKKK